MGKINSIQLRDRLQSEVWYKAVTSQGPGGQNVNKVASSAVLFWIPELSAIFDVQTKHFLISKLESYINQNGEIQIRCQEFRDLPKNKKKCLDKLVFLIQKCLHIDKKRIHTKPTFSAQKKRIESKRSHAKIKSLRKKIREED